MEKLSRVLSAGRVDRATFLLAIVGVFLMELVATRYLAGFSDFASAGALVDHVWNGRWLSYRDQISGLAPLNQVLVVGCHLGAGLFCIAAGMARLREIGWPPLLSAPFFVIAAPIWLVVLAVTPGGFGRRRGEQAPVAA
jgi:hypothetical protein